MLRPLAAAQDASPAPLRLSLKPAAGGIEIGFVKRQGPRRDEPLFVPMPLDAIAPLRTHRKPAERPTIVPGTAQPAARERTWHLQPTSLDHAT